MSIELPGIFWSFLFYDDLSLAWLRAEAQNVLKPYPAWLTKAHEKRQRNFLAGRTVAHQVLAHCELDLRIGVRESGALYLETCNGEESPDWRLSISHTDGLAVAAISTGAVGIDVESITERAARPLRRMAGREERESFARDWGSESSTLLWCGKEAFGKMREWGVWRMKGFRLESSGPKSAYSFLAYEGEEIQPSGVGYLQRVAGHYVALVAPTARPCYRIQAAGALKIFVDRISEAENE